MASDSILHDHGVTIPVDSGTIGATKYSQRDTSEPSPAVLMYIPYRKDDWIVYGHHYPAIEYLVKNGYEVVIADCLGTGGSSGFKNKPFSPDEGQIGKEIVEWIAKQHWCTGSVGMYGKSYGGYLQLKTAAKQPDGLEAIVPVCAPFQMYDHSRYPGGAMSLKHPAGWLPFMHGFASLPPSYRDNNGRWAEVWSTRLDKLEDSEPWLFQHVENEVKNEYWEEMDPDISAIEVPIFAVSGWRDYYPHASVNQLPKVDVPKRILLGPWRHSNPERGRETAVDFRSQMVEWFDHFLKGEKNGALNHPKIVYWTERDGGGKIEGGVWRGIDSWPRSRDSSAELSFSFSSNGLVPTKSFDSGEVAEDYEIDHTVGMSAIDYLDVPIDTNTDDIRSLCFRTKPLSQPTEFTGTGNVSIRFRSTSKDPLLVVRIVDVSPDGSGSLVTYGYLKASHRDGHSNPKPLDPGQEYEVSIPLQPVSHVFESGHSIRVAVSGGWFPRVIPSREHGRLTVLSTPESPSTLQFPGAQHNHGIEFDDTLTMNPPDTTVPVVSKFLDQNRSIEVNREQLTDRGTMRISNEESIDLPHGPTMRKKEDMTWSVNAQDPSTFKIDSEITIELHHDRENIMCEISTYITHDTAKLSEHLTVEDQTLMEKTWRM